MLQQADVSIFYMLTASARSAGVQSRLAARLQELVRAPADDSRCVWHSHHAHTPPARSHLDRAAHRGRARTVAQVTPAAVWSTGWARHLHTGGAQHGRE